MVDFVDVLTPSAIAAQEIAGALTEAIAACQASRQATGVEEVFLDFQVEKSAQGLRSNASPTYPSALRAANIEVQVVAQFAVDTSGRADVQK